MNMAAQSVSGHEWKLGDGGGGAAFHFSGPGPARRVKVAGVAAVSGSGFLGLVPFVSCFEPVWIQFATTWHHEVAVGDSFVDHRLTGRWQCGQIANKQDIHNISKVVLRH